MSVGSQQLSASNGQAGADSSTLQSLAGGGVKESLSDKVKHPFHHGQSLCCHSMSNTSSTGVVAVLQASFTSLLRQRQRGATRLRAMHVCSVFAATVQQGQLQQPSRGEICLAAVCPQAATIVPLAASVRKKRRNLCGHTLRGVQQCVFPTCFNLLLLLLVSAGHGDKA
jgi:hypothetical protein